MHVWWRHPKHALIKGKGKPVQVWEWIVPVHLKLQVHCHEASDSCMEDLWATSLASGVS